MRSESMIAAATRHARSAPRLALHVVLVACLVAVALLACGCRDSDALKEIIYDQTSLNIDYDNPDKFLVNDSSAEQKNDSIPAEEHSDSAAVTDQKQNLVVYSSEPNAPQFTAKKSVWDPNPDFKGLEASETVKFYESDDTKATEQDIPKTEEPEEKPDEPEEEHKSVKASSKGKSSDKGSGGSGKSTKKGKRSSKKAKKKKNEKTNDGAGSGGKVKQVDTTGDYTDVEKVDRVAAFGQAAVMVQMLAGKGALVAADKDLLDSEFSNVFADEGADEIAVGWKDDGSPEKIDVDAIIEAKADTIIVMSEDYQDDLTAQQRKKLTKAGIGFTQLSPTTNSGFIKADVKTVGEMLAKSSAIEKGTDTQAMAKAYVKFHDKLVEACMKANGGKLAASADNQRAYEKTDESYSFNADATYTLLIDAYDESARYADTEDGWPKTNGIALANVGYATTPVSFYIQAGGLVNNAAARGDDGRSGLRVVWQFYNLKYSKAKLSYDAGGPVDGALDTKGSDWGNIMLTTDLNEHQIGVGSSYGTATFPKVIAANQRIRKLFLNNGNDKNGAYYPYHVPERESSEVVYFGKMLDGFQVYSCIGVDGDQSEDNAFEDGIDEDSVVTNPHGLFSSWTEGTVEAVLEAAWVNDVVNGEGSSVGWQDKVEEFYETFYRYDCSKDMSDIEAGARK